MKTNPLIWMPGNKVKLVRHIKHLLLSVDTVLTVEDASRKSGENRYYVRDAKGQGYWFYETDLETA